MSVGDGDLAVMGDMSGARDVRLDINTVPDTLNKRCTTAMVSPAAALASVAANAASKAVTVVPTLAPSVTGNASLSLSTPAPASGTKSDVVIELDWTITVATTPTTMAMTAFPVSARDSSDSMWFRIEERMTVTIPTSVEKIRRPLTAM